MRYRIAPLGPGSSMNQNSTANTCRWEAAMPSSIETGSLLRGSVRADWPRQAPISSRARSTSPSRIAAWMPVKEWLNCLKPSVR